MNLTEKFSFCYISDRKRFLFASGAASEKWARAYDKVEVLLMEVKRCKMRLWIQTMDVKIQLEKIEFKKQFGLNFSKRKFFVVLEIVVRKNAKISDNFMKVASFKAWKKFYHNKQALTVRKIAKIEQSREQTMKFCILLWGQI
jgi:hypothetical protein